MAGNHEFYGYGDVLANGDSWEKMLQPDVGYYQNKVVRIDDTDLFCQRSGHISGRRMSILWLVG